MTLATLIRWHQSAFAFFGGWPRRILFDNMRQVVVGLVRTNARFLDFTRHHGFEVKRCRPYRPRTKVKVERSVSCLRDSLLNGRTLIGLDDLSAQGWHWVGHVSNVRVHATTQARSCDRLLEDTLTPCAGLNAHQVAHSTARTVGVGRCPGHRHAEGPLDCLPRADAKALWWDFVLEIGVHPTVC